MSRRRAAPRVFFPWERRAGLLGSLGRTARTRIRLVLVGLAVATAVVLVFRREDEKAATRATRASIQTATRAVASYRADHAGACPRVFAELVAGRYAREVPLDAWGRPLQLTCPSRRDPAGFDVTSDGPDGLPGGTDRVE